MKKLKNLIKKYFMSFKKSLFAFLGITAMLSTSNDYGLDKSPSRPSRAYEPSNKPLTPEQKQNRDEYWYHKRCERMGLTCFQFGGSYLYALNQKNADRKAKNLNWI